MTLRQLVRRLSVELESAHPVDLEWAQRICVLSRFIHETVWQSQPDHDYVREEVLPLFALAAAELRSEALQAKCADDGDRESIAVFARNLEMRSKNLGNYLDDRPSGFPPDSVLETVKEAYGRNLTARQLMERVLAEGPP